MLLHPFEKAAVWNFTGTWPFLFALHYRDIYTNLDREIDTCVSADSVY